MLFAMITSPKLLGKHKHRTHDVARKVVQGSDILVYRSIVSISRMLFITPIWSHKYILLGQPRLFYYLLVTFHPLNTYIIKDLIDLRLILVYIQKGSTPVTNWWQRKWKIEKSFRRSRDRILWRMHPVFADISGLLCHLIVHKIACGDAASTTASYTTSRVCAGQRKLTPGRDILKYHTVHHIYRSGP